MAERCHHVDKVQKPTNAKSDSKEEKIETARRLLQRVANDLGSSPLVEDLKQHEDILVRELTSALVDEGFLKGMRPYRHVHSNACTVYSYMKPTQPSTRAY